MYFVFDGNSGFIIFRLQMVCFMRQLNFLSEGLQFILFIRYGYFRYILLFLGRRIFNLRVKVKRRRVLVTVCVVYFMYLMNIKLVFLFEVLMSFEIRFFQYFISFKVELFEIVRVLFFLFIGKCLVNSMIQIRKIIIGIIFLMMKWGVIMIMVYIKVQVYR